MFKYKTEVSTLPEVKVFTPEPYTDYRGTMWTYWESSMDTPQSKISKFTRSRKMFYEDYTEIMKLQNISLVFMVHFT